MATENPIPLSGTPVPLAALANRIDTLLDSYRDRIEEAVFRDDIPLLGAEFAAQAATALAFVDTLKADARAVIEGIGTASATLQQIADAFAAAGVGINPVPQGAKLALEFVHSGETALAGATAAIELAGLGAGATLEAGLDLAADITAGLVLVLDANAGTVTVDTSFDTEFSMDLTGGLLPDGALDLGFLDTVLGTASARDGIALEFAVDLDGLALNTTLSGDAVFGRTIATTAPAEILPTISADFALGFHFDAVAMQTGVALAAEGMIGLENITLDMGGLVDFLSSILGQIADIANTFPLGTLIDILTTPIPVLDDIAPGSLDKTGDGSISATDLILGFGDSGDNLGFIAALEALFDVLETIDELRGLADTVDLGDLTLGGAATASFGAEFDLAGLGVGSTLRTDLMGLISGTGLDGLLTGLLPEGAAEINRLVIPLLEDPLGTIGGLLLNGFYSEPVTLMSYDLPPMGFSVNPRLPFNVGPLSFFIGGKFSAETDFGVGYDTAGFGPGALDVPAGFYITTVDGGRVDPFITLGFGMEAGGGVGVGVAKVSIVGGVGGEVDLFLAGGGEKVRLGDLLPCLFDPISGEIIASLEVEVKVGVGVLSVTDRITLGETVLAQFGFDPCNTDFDPATMRFVDGGLATATKRDTLLLNVGARSGLRDVPGRIDLAEAYKPLNDATLDLLRGTGTNVRADNEVFHVALAPEADGAGPGALAVSAFGIYELFEPKRSFTQVRADGGSGNDRLSAAADLDIAVRFDGGTGADHLTGGSRDDSLRGEAGNDRLIGNDGDDTLDGGAGDDLLTGGRGADAIIGGLGFDEADYTQSSAGVSLRVVTRGGFTELRGSGGDAQGDVLTGIEHIQGSAFDDTLRADPGLDTVLQGNDGDDTLIGGRGDDLLAGGRGADTIKGGKGKDSVSYAFSDAGVLIDMEHGLVTGGEATGDTLVSIEVFQLSWHGDTFQGSLTDKVRETVYAFEGNDWLDGGAGKDILDAGGGDDTVVGRAEGDVLDGGAGRDLLTFAGLFDAPSIRATDGVDVSLSDGTAALADGSRPGDILREETRTGADGTSETLAGNSSFEDVTGSLRDDTIEGDGDANVLRGLDGGDTLRGLGGDDVLVGGAGFDDLQGGAGFDLVDYSESPDAVDVNLLTGKGNGGDADGDTLTGIEAVRGSAYADTLTGNLSGNDIDVGGFQTRGTEAVDGGFGQDRLIVNWGEATLDLEVIGLPGSDGWLRHIDSLGAQTRYIEWQSIEAVSVTTGSGNDIVASIFDGPAVDEPGADHFSGDDYISTGAGDDTINAGAGADRVFAGSGDDEVARTKATVAQTFWIDGGGGIDGLTADLSYDTGGVTLISTSILEENHLGGTPLAGGGIFTGFEILRDITTGSGDDVLVQLGRVNNVFNTGDGADTVTLDYGNNTVDAGNGDGAVDTLILDYTGEAGYALTSQLRILIVPGIGGGTLETFEVGLAGISGPPFLLPYASTYKGFEKVILTGTENDDTIEGLRHAGGGDVLDGAGGDDTISGNDGDDTLIGGVGADTLLGGNGADILDGGKGVDWLWGGAVNRADGIDELTGGTGRDHFVLGDETDTFYGDFANDFARILDFDSSIDRLHLHGVAGDYTLAEPSGDRTEIRLAATGEKVAVLIGVTGFSLADPSVVFDNTVTENPAPAPALFAGPAAIIVPPPPPPPPPPLGPTFEIHDYGPGDPLQQLVIDGLDDAPLRSLNITGFTLEGNLAGIKAFSDAPFGLEEGVVFSTGIAQHLDAPNTADGAEARGALGGSETALVFEKVGATAGGSAVFRADLSGLAGGLTTLTLTDSFNLEGAVSLFSGFDLDGLLLSPDRIDAVAGVVDLAGATVLDVFDFSPAGTRLEAGTMRDPGLFDTLAGTIDNAVIDESFARLGAIDYNGNVLDGGAVTLGDGGRVTFELTETLPTGTGPLYLYVAEAFDAGEELSGSMRVTDADSSSEADASTDIGAPGATGDGARATVEFVADLKGKAKMRMVDLFNVVIVSEELPEFAGAALQDLFDVRINGLPALVLSDGRQATLQNLAASPLGGFAPELNFNLVGEGLLEDELSADAYTTILRVRGPVFEGDNRVEFSVADGADGLRDTAIFVSALQADTVKGTGGNDLLAGSSADDLMIGEGGGDTLAGGHGWDTYFFTGADIREDVVDETGGSGFDVIELDVNPADIGFVRSGSNLVIQFKGADSGRSITVLRHYVADSPTPGVEQIRFTDGTVIDLAGPLAFTGTSGDDRGGDALTGTVLGETIDGRAGRDTINGLGGDDVLIGGSSNDVLDGGTGGDVLKGGDGNDELLGDLGDDTLRGGTGDDTLRGGEGDDVLRGDDGNDILLGGAGFDRMTGGSGADSFAFLAAGESPDASPDRITDFERGTDRIDLSAFAGPLGWIGLAGFSGLAGEVRFDRASARLLADLDGDGAADFAVELTGVTRLGAGDLLL